jgi:hypothetical protein
MGASQFFTSEIHWAPFIQENGDRFPARPQRAIAPEGSANATLPSLKESRLGLKEVLSR